jgi:hypothetical protein
LSNSIAQFKSAQISSSNTLKHGIETTDFASIGATVGTAAGILYGFLAKSEIEIAIFTILFSTSISYFLQRTIQRNTREYEKRKLSVTEGLSEVHADLIDISTALINNPKACTLNIPQGEHWQSIWHSYRQYLIEIPLRTELEDFFRKLIELNSNDLRNRMLVVGGVRAAATLKTSTAVDFPAFYFLSSEGNRYQPSRIDVAFTLLWRQDPEKRFGKLAMVDLPSPSGQVYKQLSGDEARNFYFEFVEEIRKQLAEDATLSEGLRLYAYLQKESVRLFQKVAEKITDWVE